MSVSVNDYSLDIETTGLDPMVDRIVTVAMVGAFGDDIHVWDSEDEGGLLATVCSLVRRFSIADLVTWNGSEFDLPFIAVRMVLHGFAITLPILSPTDPTGAPLPRGKYGRPRYWGYWSTARLVDVAYDYEGWARENGVKWSLKPVAESLGLGKGTEVDFSTTSILDLTSDERKLHCVSDAQLTFRLHEGRHLLLDRPGVQAQAQA